jgi:phosphate transport system permease protein
MGMTSIEVNMSEKTAITQPPTRLQQTVDVLFRKLCVFFAGFSAILVAFIVLKIVTAAMPAMRQYGFHFLTGTTWDPNKDEFAVLPEVWGTLYTSILALILGTAFGLAAALFLSEGYLSEAVFRILRVMNLHVSPAWSKLPDQLEMVLNNLIELLAAIPSVVYGLWGLFVVIPMIRPLCNWLHGNMSWFPFFSTDLSGPGVLPASIVLSIMILPTITAISRHALTSVPGKIRMAAYGMGATRWETILAVLLPTASRGILGGIILAFGRALGETMALAMLVGNANVINFSLFSPANTLAALLANSFPEARGKEIGVLMYAAVVLLAITLVVNAIGSMIIQRASAGMEGAR